MLSRSATALSFSWPVLLASAAVALGACGSSADSTTSQKKAAMTAMTSDADTYETSTSYDDAAVAETTVDETGADTYTDPETGTDTCTLSANDGAITRNPDGSATLSGSFTATPSSPYSITGEPNEAFVITFDGTLDRAANRFSFSASAGGIAFSGTAPTNGDPIDETMVNVDAFFTNETDTTIDLVENPRHAWIGNCGVWNVSYNMPTGGDAPKAAEKKLACNDAAEKYPLSVELWKAAKAEEDNADFWKDAISIITGAIDVTPARWLKKLPLILKSAAKTKIAASIIGGIGVYAEDKRLKSAREILAALQATTSGLCSEWKTCCNLIVNVVGKPELDDVNCDAKGNPKPGCETDPTKW